MARHSTRIAVALVSVVITTAAGAAAQGRTVSPPADPLVFGTGATYEVKFDDDPLAALPNGAIIPRIVVRTKEPTARLHRPRTQFVSEMLKSADGF